MLLKIGVKNYKSFREYSEMDFTFKGAIRDSLDIKVLEGNYFTGNKVLKLAALCGKNASGKTNFFTVLEHLTLVFDENAKKDIWDFSPFLYDKNKENSSIFISFISKKTYYEYSCEVNVYSKKIFSESLKYKRNNGKQQVLFEIKDGKLNSFSKKYIKENPEFLKKLIEKREESKSFISLIQEYKLEKLDIIQNFTHFFKHTLEIHTIIEKRIYSSTLTGIIFLKLKMKECLDELKKKNKNIDFENYGQNELFLYYKEKIKKKTGIFFTLELLSLIETFIKSLDLGVKKIALKKESDICYPYFPVDSDKKNSITELNNYSIVTFHKNNIKLNICDESSGNKKLIELATSIIFSLIKNKVLIIDEFSNYFHQRILERILMLFRRYNKNSQFIFSSHNPNVLDLDLKKEQIFISDKNSEEETKISSLKETSFNKKLSFAKLYLNGLLGSEINDDLIDFEFSLEDFLNEEED